MILSELPPGGWHQIWFRFHSPADEDLGCSPCAVVHGQGEDKILLQDGPYGLLEYCYEHGYPEGYAGVIENALVSQATFFLPDCREVWFCGFRAQLIEELPDEYHHA